MFRHVERLIGQRRRKFEHQRRERRIPTQRLELGEMLDGTLGALTGQFEPIVLVNPGGSLGLNTKGTNQGQALDQLDSGITMNVVSKNEKLASKKFVMDDVGKRFTKDAVIVIYACHGAVDTAFVQRIADTFQVKVRAFRDVIGYYPD